MTMPRIQESCQLVVEVSLEAWIKNLPPQDNELVRIQAFAELTSSVCQMEISGRTLSSGHFANNRIAKELVQRARELGVEFNPPDPTYRPKGCLGTAETNPLWNCPMNPLEFRVNTLDDPGEEVCRLFAELCSMAGEVHSMHVLAITSRYVCTYDRQPIAAVTRWQQELNRLNEADAPLLTPTPDPSGSSLLLPPVGGVEAGGPWGLFQCRFNAARTSSTSPMPAQRHSGPVHERTRIDVPNQASRRS